MQLKAVLTLCAALALHALTAPALADTYPSRPVRIIVPYATGGGSDILARQLGAVLQTVWGQAVVVDNRAGASGNIGTEAVVHSAGDGYTLLLQNSTMLSSLAVSGKLNYDPEKDLTPIMLLGITPIALASHPSVNIRNVKDLVAYAKAHPQTLAYGSCGIGTPQHFVMEVVKQKTGVDASHAGYKGCSPALTDVLAGQIPLAVVSANLVAPHAKTGKLNVVGVSSTTRYNLLADSLTFEEQGIKPLALANWYALMGPAKMAPEVVNRIYGDVLKILARPDIKANLSNAGVEPYIGDAAALTKLIRAEQVNYLQVAKSANIKAE